MTKELQTTDRRMATLGQKVRGQHKRILALFENDNARALKFIAGAITVIERNPDLLNATPSSVLGCLLEAASLGLQPGALSYVHFVRFKSVCTLIPDYRGLVALALAADEELLEVRHRVVYRDDPFRLLLGDDERIEHSPGPNYGDDDVDPDVGYPEAIVGAYAVAIYRDGRRRHEFMTAAQIEKVRAVSMAARKGPWVTDWPEQARKTVVRRLAKTLPKAPIVNRLAVLDELAERGLSQGLDGRAGTGYVEGEKDAGVIVDGAEVIDIPEPKKADPEKEPPEATEKPEEKPRAEPTRKATRKATRKPRSSQRRAPAAQDPPDVTQAPGESPDDGIVF